MLIHHKPVFLSKIQNDLIREQDRFFLDATLGEGGHSLALLEMGLRGIGLDRDNTLCKKASIRLKKYIEANCFQTKNINYAFADEIYLSKEAFDFILFDLGISKYHYFESGRGFSFSSEEDLDMRLEVESESNAHFSPDTDELQSARDVVNHSSEKRLVEIFSMYGEIRNAKTLASKIVEVRNKTPINTTKQLVEIIENIGSFRKRNKFQRIHLATLPFQAIRIAVNRELDYIERGIQLAAGGLKKDGRLAIISYHSLEDRIVKKTLNGMLIKSENKNKYRITSGDISFDENNMNSDSKPSVDANFADEEVARNKQNHFSSEYSSASEAKLRYLSGKKKISRACRDEIISNPAARSAKLRVVERVVE